MRTMTGVSRIMLVALTALVFGAAGEDWNIYLPGGGMRPNPPDHNPHTYMYSLFPWLCRWYECEKPWYHKHGCDRWDFDKSWGGTDWKYYHSDNGMVQDERSYRLSWETVAFWPNFTPPATENLDYNWYPWADDGGGQPDGQVFAGMPNFCMVIGHIKTTGDPLHWHGIRLAMVIPDSPHWNRRILAVGNEGFSSDFNWRGLASGLGEGYVTVSTESAYSSPESDEEWVDNNAQKQEDWGWRAFHASVQTAVSVTNWFYDHTGYDEVYFMGCGNGGRQGLREAQLFPHTFDGLVIGAPTWDMTGWSNWATRAFVQNNLDDQNHINATILPYLAEEVVRQCDRWDLTLDSVISRPSLCEFDYAAIQCGESGVNATWCLTPGQVERVKSMYSEYQTQRGQPVYQGLSYGSELEWEALLTGEPNELALGFLRHFIQKDPHWDWRNYDESLALLADHTNRGQVNVPAGNLTRFMLRGGKIIMYQGMADAIVPPRGTVNFYQSLGVNMDEWKRDQFIRYFQIPGMQHCSGTAHNAPWYINAPGQAAYLEPYKWPVDELKNEDHDVLRALHAWRRYGRKVDKLIATTWRDPKNPSSGYARQRPICPFPLIATYPYTWAPPAGPNPDDEANWECR